MSRCKNFRFARIVVVERNGALVAVRGKKIGGHGAYKWRTPCARLISRVRAFDLDDVGAKIAEQHGAIRTGQRLGQLNYPDSIEDVLHAPIIADAEPKNRRVRRSRGETRIVFTLYSWTL